MEEIKKLQPRAFTKFCMSIGAVPSSYLEGMTIERQLLWLCSYLEKEVIPAVNQAGGAVEELQALYTQLLEYVNNYFENLDVQEEINNKLDEMAESGELAEIIAQYVELAAVVAYDTKAAMKAASNLFEGSICKTLGNTNYADGQGAFYRVREALNTDVIDDNHIIALSDPELVAVKIKDYGIIGYNSVSELKAANNLMNGSLVQTYGYYGANDGGAAKYKVRIKTNDDTADDCFLIALQDTGLIAELIVDNKTLNAKVFGAKGDGETDDTAKLQYLLNQTDYDIEIPNGTYITSDSIDVIGFSDRSLNFNHSVIKYSGDDYAFIMKSMRNDRIDIGTIESENGGCLKFTCTQGSEYSQYLNITFDIMKANELFNCIYVYKTGGWINEFRIHDGRFQSGLYAIEFDNHSGEDYMDGHKLYNLGIEGVLNGIWFNATQSWITNCSMDNLRYQEFNSYTYLLKTTGNVAHMNFSGAHSFHSYKQSFSSTTNNIQIFAPVSVGNYVYNGAVVMGGRILPTESRFPVMNGTIENLQANDDLNDYRVPGTYTSSSNAVTNSLVNKPSAIVNNGLKLFVISLNSENVTSSAGYKYGIQILIWQNGRMFIRGYEGTSFSSWKEITAS